MRNRSTCLHALVAAIVLSAVMAGGASASRSLELSVAEGELGSVRAVTSRYNFYLSGEEPPWTCEITRTFRFNRLFEKRVGATVATLTSVTPNCRNAPRLFRFLMPREAEEPQPQLTYSGFSGTLPNITTLRFNLTNFRFLMEIGIFTCLFAGTMQENGNVFLERGRRMMRSLSGEASIPLFAILPPISICYTEVIVQGTLTLTPALGVTLM